MLFFMIIFVMMQNALRQDNHADTLIPFLLCTSFKVLFIVVITIASVLNNVLVMPSKTILYTTSPLKSMGVEGNIRMAMQIHMKAGEFTPNCTLNFLFT